MLNLTFILTYPQASPSRACDLSQKHSTVVAKNPSFKYMMLFLIWLTAMALFQIFDCRKPTRRQDQRQQDRLSALENGMKDITGKLLPNAGCPALDEDDDFRLPPPAYEFHERMIGD